MHVSAGGYVRSVAHELGQLAGCGAHLVEFAEDAGWARLRWSRRLRLRS